MKGHQTKIIYSLACASNHTLSVVDVVVVVVAAAVVVAVVVVVLWNEPNPFHMPLHTIAIYREDSETCFGLALWRFLGLCISFRLSDPWC